MKALFVPCLTDRIVKLSALLALILVASSKLSGQETVAEWQRKAIEKYPSLGLEGSAFNTCFVELHHVVKRERPELLADPRWPMALADHVASFVSDASIPGIDTPHSRRTAMPRPELITAEDVKRKWFQDIRNPDSLDSRFHEKKKEADRQREAITAGRRDIEAQTRADEINATRLLESGYVEEAKILLAKVRSSPAVGRNSQLSAQVAEARSLLGVNKPQSAEEREIKRLRAEFESFKFQQRSNEAARETEQFLRDTR